MCEAGGVCIRMPLPFECLMDWRKTMDKVTIDGRSYDAVSFPTAHSVVLMIRGGKGFLGCGYLSVATADKTGDALAIVSGVKTYDDMLNASVKAVSAAAAELGVAVGMSGKEALEKFF